MSFNINNPTHISELNTELTTDPQTLAYTPSDGDDAADAGIINLPRVSIQRDNFVRAFDISEAVDPADWPTVNSDQFKRDLWRDVLLSAGSQGLINANANNIKAKVLVVFAAASATRANLLALQTRDGSRAEMLWGDGSFVTVAAIAIALRGA